MTQDWHAWGKELQLLNERNKELEKRIDLLEAQLERQIDLLVLTSVQPLPKVEVVKHKMYHGWKLSPADEATMEQYCEELDNAVNEWYTWHPSDQHS